MKKFKGYLGALDRIYIEVTILECDKSRYRTRKCKICTNILRVCNPDMNFVYVLSNYYLVDAGSTNGLGFLAPYRGTHYHVSMDKCMWSDKETKDFVSFMEEFVVDSMKADCGQFQPETFEKLALKMICIAYLDRNC
ncbi:hypothetical protein AHAS_Ahas15G0157400 [Arachis hypogaea]